MLIFLVMGLTAIMWSAFGIVALLLSGVSIFPCIIQNFDKHVTGGIRQFIRKILRVRRSLAAVAGLFCVKRVGRDS